MCFPTIGCLVMASGQSVRFGSNKLLAPFGSIPLLAATLKNIPAHYFKQRLVVTRTPECCDIAKQYQFDSLLHQNPLRRQALALGIEKMQQYDACLVIQADQPLCLPQSYQALVEAFFKNPQGFYRLGWQSIEASPVLFPSSAFGELLSLTENCGGSVILANHCTELSIISATHPWELQDADTPQQLESLLQIAKKFQLI